MTWFILFLAGLLEIGWAIGLKYSAGFTKLVPSALTLLSMVGSVVMLGLALRTLPLGTAYAVWTGIGAVGSVLAGLLLFGEAMGAARLAAVVAIVGGVVALKVLPA